MSSKRNLMATGLVVVAFAVGVIGGRTWHASEQPATTTETASAGTAGSVGEHAAEPVTWYTCGMHPEVVQNEPGNCPKCGMKLQPMSADRAAAMGLTTAAASGAKAASDGTQGEPSGATGSKGKILYWKSSMIPGEIHSEPGKDAMGMDLIPVYEGEQAAPGTIRIDPVVEQDMGVRVDKVIRGPLVKSVRTVGVVEYDETSLAVVTTKVDGWIQKLHVDQTGAQVHAGDALFELYSPALYSAQEEYLSALRGRGQRDPAFVSESRIDARQLVSDARTRLEYFDVPREEIDRIEKEGHAQKTLTIRAPFTGIVTTKNVVEGQKIMAGMDLFRIADLSTVWVVAKVFEYDLPYVKVGQEALMSLAYLPGKTYRGRVTFVYPYLDPKTRTVSVRMEFHNPGYDLKPGMYATVMLRGHIADQATLVPDVAVIRTGRRSVAFTMPEPGRYEPREVEVGVRDENNYLEVLSGLSPGETVVVSGQFLLDSESRLREAATKFMEPGTVSGATPIVAATEEAEAREAGEPMSTAPAAEEEDRLYYVCPMPEHVDILYDKPGVCPICGMKLVPVRRHAGHVDKPKIAYWTCPMPEHASVHEPGPGKCPICGMSLIPVPAKAAAAAAGSEHPMGTATPQQDSGHDDHDHDHDHGMPAGAAGSGEQP